MLELARNRNEDRRSTQVSGLHILSLTSHNQLSQQDLLHSDGILVNADSSYEAELILREIRSNQSKLIALKPVFINSILSFSEKISYLFDGIWTETYPENTLQKIRLIQERVKQSGGGILELDFNRSVTERICQFLFTREIQLTPQRSREINTGFGFPFISSVFQQSEGLKAIHLLDEMHDKGFLEGKASDVIQSCNTCSGGYFNYRECCPSCGSSDLATSDLIHHFVCAHVAPEETFRKDDNLECPKCDKTLRHIGIDYDKPSSMYTCRSCNNQFQNATVKALCVDCGTDNELSLLKTVAIKSYSLTTKGLHLAKNGYRNEPAKPAETQKNILSEDIYKLFRKQEMLRASSTEKPLFEGTLTLNYSTLQNFNEERLRMIQHEICNIISHYLSELDLVCSPNVQNYKMILCNSNADTAKQIGEVIENNISRLLADGLGGEQQSTNLTFTDISRTA